MSYLDVSPMIMALRTTRTDFEMNRGWLRHIPSRHNFKFDSQGNVRLSASCGCSRLAVNPDQRHELWVAFKEWHVDYWHPLETNHEFASHFRPSAWWQRLPHWVITKLRQAIMRRAARELPADEFLAPAE